MGQLILNQRIRQHVLQAQLEEPCRAYILKRKHINFPRGRWLELKQAYPVYSFKVTNYRSHFSILERESKRKGEGD